MFSVNLALTDLGFTLLLLGYIPAFIFLRYVLLGNVPEKLPAESYAKVVVVKVVFAVLLSIMASGGGGGGVFRLVSGIAALPASLGGGYFIYSMVLDMFFIVLLWRGEFYGAAKMVMFNLPHIPFLTFSAVLYAVLVEQGKTIRRVREDLPVRKEGVLLGHAVWLMRSVRKPVRSYRDVDVRDTYDIRPLPIKAAVYYSPKISDKDLNPHMIIAGSSGTGKTTTIYSIIRELSKTNPVVLIDVKGDLTRALLSEGVPSYIVPVADVGLNPFAPMVDSDTEGKAVEDLIDSISVVEEVGSRQGHFIREAYAEMYHFNKPLTYMGLVSAVERREKESLSPDSRWGPGTRDALFSISSKLKDLSNYLRDDGASLREVLDRAVKGRKSDFPVIVFNLEGISEKARAIVLELILRKISKYLVRRGPLAYLTDIPLVLIVDEAYLVTKPMERQGRDGLSKSVLEEIARAGRSYGVALILVTQRLSDIADGIRQNCEKWLVFRTASPDDLRVLAVDDRFLTEVVTQLGKGYAYIRVVTGRKIEGTRYTSDVMATTIGYLFEIERQPLKFDGQDSEQLTVCYRCKLAVKSPRHCPFCGKPALTTRPRVQERRVAMENKQEAHSAVVNYAVHPPPEVFSPTGGAVEQAGVADTNDVFLGDEVWEEVKRKAIEQFPQERERLERLTVDQVKAFLTDYPNNLGPYARLGLVRIVGDEYKLKQPGKALLIAYKEVAGK